MIEANDFEDLILEFLAYHLEIPKNYLRKIKYFTTTPKNDCELFELYDTVPPSQTKADGICYRPVFSELYSQILSIRKESFVSALAKQNFENKNNWLLDELKHIPKYSNGYIVINETLKNASSYDFKINTTEFEYIASKFIPVKLSNTADKNPSLSIDRLMVNLHFNKFAKLPIKPLGWFNQGLFLQFFNNRAPGSEEEAVLWKQLFGVKGALTFVNKSIIVASGINLEIQFYGTKINELTDYFKNKPQTFNWHKTLNQYRLKTHFQFDENGCVTIKIQTHPDDLIFVALEINEITNVLC